MLCADLHGYDALAERLPPSQVASMLGAYFAILTDTVLEYGGMVFDLAEAEHDVGIRSRRYEAQLKSMKP